MTAAVPPRLAYDDPATPREMFGDCRAVGANLALAHPLDVRARRRPVSRTAGPAVEVSVEAATMAGRLHLHLD
jgi:hypothetical protein